MSCMIEINALSRGSEAAFACFKSQQQPRQLTQEPEARAWPHSEAQRWWDCWQPTPLRGSASWAALRASFEGFGAFEGSC